MITFKAWSRVGTESQSYLSRTTKKKKEKKKNSHLCQGILGANIYIVYFIYPSQPVTCQVADNLLLDTDIVQPTST